MINYHFERSKFIRNDQSSFHFFFLCSSSEEELEETMADALCSSAIFEQMGGKMARELLSNSSFHHTSRVKLSKGKANKGNKAAKKKTTEMFKKDFVAQLKLLSRNVPSRLSSTSWQTWRGLSSLKEVRGSR